MLQVPSFNKLEYWINKGKFKKLFPKKTRMPSADAIRFCLDKIDLSSLNSMHKSIIKTAIENKVFRNGTIDGHKVFAIDGVELFESTEKCCADCLTRVGRQGIIHYFHRAVVCISVGSDPHIILGEEMLKPKKDGSDKDAGMDIVVRAKDERLGIVKEAIAFFKSRKANKEWTVRLNKNKKVVVAAWDEDNFEMTGLDGTVRFLRFIEKISHGDKVKVKEVWMITTNKYISTETLWKIIHSRWNIENNGFHQLKGEWHLKHCFLHSPTDVEAVLIFIQVAFKLFALKR